MSRSHALENLISMLESDQDVIERLSGAMPQEKEPAKEFQWAKDMLYSESGQGTTKLQEEEEEEEEDKDIGDLVAQLNQVAMESFDDLSTAGASPGNVHNPEETESSPAHTENWGVYLPGNEQRASMLKRPGRRIQSKPPGILTPATDDAGIDLEIEGSIGMPYPSQEPRVTGLPRDSNAKVHESNETRAVASPHTTQGESNKRIPGRIPSTAPGEPGPLLSNVVRPPSVGMCSACGKAITDGTAVKVVGMLYHKRHFLCSGGCGAQLAMEPFIMGGDNKAYCKPCYSKSRARKCRVCSKDIDTAPLKVFNTFYHTRCFTCTHCGEQLYQKKFYASPKDEPVCGKCYKPRTSTAGMQEQALPATGGKWCKKCGESLEAAFVEYLQALGYYWHPKCFTCTACAKKLSVDTKFYVHNDQPFCEEHKYAM